MRYVNAFTLPIVLALFLFGSARGSDDVPDTKQTAYASPREAFRALLEGMEKNSDAQLLDVLGHDQKDLVVQSDKEASTQMREKFSKLARERLSIEENGEKAIACFGYKCWPFPIPLVKGTDGWKFDTASGKEEILNRRIGRNELRAIEFVDVYGDAQQSYFRVDRVGDKVHKYAQKLISDKDKKNGLYWPLTDAPRQDVSPMNGFYEDGQDFLDGDGTNIAYHGYYFKVLTKQGEHAPNGKYSYVINGNMIAGYALVAWPADYGASGVMTFMVSHQGTIYQKNLGADTEKIAPTITEYDPDDSWKELKTDGR